MSLEVPNNTPLNSVWNAVCSNGVKPLHRWGKWIWSHIGGPGSAALTNWETSSEDTKKSAKQIASISTAFFVLTAAGTIVTVYTPIVTRLGLGATLEPDPFSDTTLDEAAKWVGMTTNGVISLAAAGAIYKATSAVSWFFGDSKTAAKYKGIVAGVASLPARPLLNASSAWLTNTLGIWPLPAGFVAAALTTYQLNKTKPVRTSVAAGCAIASGTCLLMTSNPMTAFIVGMGPGLFAGGSVFISLYPGRYSLIPFGGKQMRLDYPTLTDEKPLPDNPSQTLKNLKGKIDNFIASYPTEPAWSNPENTLLEKIKADGLCLDEIREHLNRFKNEKKALTEDAKVEEVAVIINRWYPAIARREITASLVEKIEALPIQSEIHIKSIRQTDESLELLVENTSLFATLYVPCWLLIQANQRSEVIEKIKEIMKDLTLPENRDKSPWEMCLNTLGKDSSRWQRAVAKFCYFLFYTMGIIPDALSPLIRNVISELRKGTNSSESSKLEGIFKEGLGKLTSLLKAFSGAPEEYVNDSRRDPSSEKTFTYWQKFSIDRFGDDLLYQKVMAEKKPGDDIGKKMMAELCRELTNNLVNECFPRLEFFERFKKTTFFGIRIGIVFEAFDWVFGGAINSYARKWARSNLPKKIHSLVESGLEKTLPGQYAFKTAIARSITDLVRTLHKDLETPSTKRPLSKDQDTAIDGVADHLISALKTTELGVNSTVEQVEEFLARPKSEDEKELRARLIDGIQLLIAIYTQKPEKMEALIENILKSSNKWFAPSQTNYTKELYEGAVEQLEIECRNLLRDAVTAKVKERLNGADQKLLLEFMEGKKGEEPGLHTIQKNKGVKSFSALKTQCALLEDMHVRKDPAKGVLFLQELGHYVEILSEFANHATLIKIELFSAEVQNGFYKTFHPMYQEADSLAENALELLSPAATYNKYLLLVRNLSELDRHPNEEMPSLKELKTYLTTIKRFGNLYGANLFASNRLINQMDTLVTDRIENGLKKLAEEEAVITELEKLGAVDYCIGTIDNTKEFNDKMRAHIPRADQIELFKKIALYQEAKRTPLRPNLRKLTQDIEMELKSIFQKHRNLKDVYKAKIGSYFIKFKELNREVLGLCQKEQTAYFEQIQKKLASLKTKTELVLEEFKTSKPLLDLDLPMAELFPDYFVQAGYNRFGEPVVKSFERYITSMFALITHNDIYRGAARLAIGAFNSKYQKKQIRHK